ncbi:MAG: hypothetical protein ABSF09_10235 [Candidatus Bathyarchaeia archaeon]|jgi:hypothetical protein
MSQDDKSKKPLPKPDKDSERDFRETASTKPLRAPDKESERIFAASVAKKEKEKKDG